jgi:DNA-binding transcriptional MerR regulator
MTKRPQTQLRIGEVARQSGVGIETLRFYESRRLIAPTTRTEAGYRLYDRSVFDRLAFIKKSQSVGFSLDEIAWIVDEAKRGRRPCAEVRTLVEDRLAELDRKLAELKRYRGELKQTLDAWNREGEKDGLVCGLIEGLKPDTLHPPPSDVLAKHRNGRGRKS